MIITNIKIINKLGLHARASAKLANIASLYNSNVSIKKDDLKVDGKSIINIMMLAATKNSTIQLCVEGKDQEQANQALIDLINNRFEEEE